MYVQVKRDTKDENRLTPRKQNNNKGFFQFSDNRVESKSQKDTKIAMDKSIIQKFATGINNSIVQFGKCPHCGSGSGHKSTCPKSKTKEPTTVIYSDEELWAKAVKKQASMAKTHNPETGAPGTPDERRENWVQQSIRDLFNRMKNEQDKRLADNQKKK